MTNEMILSRLRTILNKIGIDQAVSRTLLSRGWLVISGSVSLLLLTRMLTPLQQGFYFTFVDILALQIFFELGLSTVILQFASHERAKLEWTAQGTLEGSPVAKARLAALLRFSLIWYGIVSVVIIAFLFPGGYFFFKYHEPENVSIAWQLPWLWIVLVTAGSLAISPVLSLLEGCGLVAEIAGVQLTQNVVGGLLFWLTLLRHWGLFTAPVSNTVVLTWSTVWILRHKKRFLKDLLAIPPDKQTFSWKQEVWPFQWKIGLSWLSGYFIYKLFVPSLFAMHLPVAAGQMGLSIAIMGAISGMALAWVTTKSSPFGMLIAKQEFDQLDRLFFPCFWQSLIIATLGGSLLVMIVIYLNHIHHPLSHRVLAPLPMLLLVGAVLVNHVVASEAIYLRAHKQEPFLWMSLVIGSSVAATTYFLGKNYAALGMMSGYFVVMLLVGLGCGTWIFVKKRRQWHHQSAGISLLP